MNGPSSSSSYLFSVCANRAEDNPDLHGQILYKIRIGQNGRVQEAKILGSTMNHQPYEFCFEKALTLLRFPALRRGTAEVVSSVSISRCGAY
jgi:hypothetical protein